MVLMDSFMIFFGSWTERNPQFFVLWRSPALADLWTCQLFLVESSFFPRISQQKRSTSIIKHNEHCCESQWSTKWKPNRNGFFSFIFPRFSLVNFPFPPPGFGGVTETEAAQSASAALRLLRSADVDQIDQIHVTALQPSASGEW